MNPFQFYGPQFLLFYAGLTVVTIVAVNVLRKRREMALVWSGGLQPAVGGPQGAAPQTHT